MNGCSRHAAKPDDSPSQYQATPNEVYLDTLSSGLGLTLINAVPSTDVVGPLVERLGLQIGSFGVELVLRGHRTFSLGHRQQAGREVP
jgi:hypothetical protein